MDNPICPRIFIRKLKNSFSIVTVYVDDLNLIGTPEELAKIATYLKKEFEMKDLQKTKFCLGLNIKHFREGIFLHKKRTLNKS